MVAAPKLVTRAMVAAMKKGTVVVDVARRLGQLMIADDSFDEIEINPILLRAQGAVAVDALIRKVTL